MNNNQNEQNRRKLKKGKVSFLEKKEQIFHRMKI